MSVDIEQEEDDLSDSVCTTLSKMWKIQSRPQFLIFTLFILQNAFLQGMAATSQYKIIENTIALDERDENMTKVKIG